MEIGLLSFRVKEYNEDINFEWLLAKLDLLKENREHSVIRMVSYHQRIAIYYNALVKVKKFRVSDLVLDKSKFHSLQSKKSYHQIGKARTKWTK